MVRTARTEKEKKSADSKAESVDRNMVMTEPGTLTKCVKKDKRKKKGRQRALLAPIIQDWCSPFPERASKGKLLLTRCTNLVMEYKKHPKHEPMRKMVTCRELFVRVHTASCFAGLRGEHTHHRLISCRFSGISAMPHRLSIYCSSHPILMCRAHAGSIASE